MPAATTRHYLAQVTPILARAWPDNRTVNLVFHGHSVPAGYFATPFVDTFHAYPHLLHRTLKRRFPHAVLNTIVTAIGGEAADQGAARFERDVLPHRPDVLFLDYGLNDRGIGLVRSEAAWRRMIETAQAHDIPMILLTPTADITQVPSGCAPCTVPGEADNRIGFPPEALPAHAEQIRGLAAAYGVGLADSFAAFARYANRGDMRDLLSWVNHPNHQGHALVAREIARWFPSA
jgi:acyl-CoA thioesterase-1